MNFIVNFNEPPTLIRMVLALSELFLLAPILIAMLYFISWELPPNIYFRWLGLNIVIVLIFAYLNAKDNR